MSFFAKRMAVFSLCLALVICSTGCMGSASTKVSKQTDIITQKPQQSGKIPVTILVKYAFSINAFEKAAEEKFPDLNIIQVGNYTSDRGLVEYARRLEHDDLTDIVMTWPLDVGSEYWADRLLDLSGMPFTGNYNTSMLNQISQGGALYYLPGPAQVRGIVYNKTLFQEKGWQVPTSFDEFVALCQTIEQTGMRAFQLGFANAEVFDTAFIGYSYGECYSKPQDAQKIVDFNEGNGSFGDHFLPALRTFEQMIDAGIWKKSDLSISYPDREKMIFTRQCAMIEDSVLLARMGPQYNGCTDEFALMPFFTPGTDGDWARLYMVCYIGLSKHLAEPANKEKYQLVLDLVEYISTPEGQEALSADTGAMYSCVKGVPPPNIPEIAALRTTLTEGRYAIFSELKNAQGALREGLAGLLKGELTSEDIVTMVDKQNQAPVEAMQEESLGTATEDFTLIETGNLITDVMRKKAKSDVALFLDNGKDGKYNGKGVSARLYEGHQLESDVVRILPDLKYGEKGTLQTVEMTGENLIKALEYTLPVANDDQVWFYYFSGLNMEYAPAGEPGTRIKSITDLDGKPIDPKRLYSVAVMDFSVNEAFITRIVAEYEITIKELLIEHIQSTGSIAPSNDGRFTVIE